MSVFLPEKTLEHWCSQHINYRYLSHAALWWPSQGEDISIGHVLRGAGKSIQLELKTATVVPRGHQVVVDWAQLLRYLTRRLALQPFYAFPVPDAGITSLEADAWSRGLEVTDFAFQRSQRDWFGNSMRVVTAADVNRIMLAGHGNPPKDTSRPHRRELVRWDSGSPTWASKWDHFPAKELNVRLYEWIEFWDMFDRCGRPGWPQIIRTPWPPGESTPTGGRSWESAGPLSHTEIANAYRQMRELEPEERPTALRTFSAAEDDEGEFFYEARDLALGVEHIDSATAPVDREPGTTENRVQVFVGIDAKRVGPTKPGN